MESTAAGLPLLTPAVLVLLVLLLLLVLLHLWLLWLRQQRDAVARRGWADVQDEWPERWAAPFGCWQPSGLMLL